jgi:hypothetical protein
MEILSGCSVLKSLRNPFGEVTYGHLVVKSAIKKADVVTHTLKEMRQEMKKMKNMLSGVFDETRIWGPTRAWVKLGFACHGMLKDAESNQPIGFLALDDLVLPNQRFEISLIFCGISEIEQLHCLAISPLADSESTYRRVGRGCITKAEWLHLKTDRTSTYTSGLDGFTVTEVPDFEGLKGIVTIL